MNPGKYNIERKFRVGSVQYSAETSHLMKEGDFVERINDRRDEICGCFGMVEVDGEEEMLNGELPENFDGIPYPDNVSNLPSFRGDGEFGEYELKVGVSPWDMVPFHSYRKIDLSVERRSRKRLENDMEHIEEEFF
ncbi:MAG: hypothetical protein ABEJ72_01085 [Candidatus Aenigmatarchaeota archaeon]